ncbi:hypothetical protein ACF073_36360 [Streptomyces sp. NPDC015171]
MQKTQDTKGTLSARADAQNVARLLADYLTQAHTTFSRVEHTEGT